MPNPHTIAETKVETKHQGIDIDKCMLMFLCFDSLNDRY